MIIPKLTRAFSLWNCTGLPTYVKTARIIALSQEGSKFPDVENIRTIAILPAMMKIYEKVVIKRLQAILKIAGDFHHSQGGFVEKRSTAQNIEALLSIIKQGKNLALSERNLVKKSCLRKKYVLKFQGFA